MSLPPITWRIDDHQSREYARTVGDPLLGTVTATTKHEAEALASARGLGWPTGPWAVPAPPTPLPPSH